MMEPVVSQLSLLRPYIMGDRFELSMSFCHSTESINSLVPDHIIPTHLQEFPDEIQKLEPHYFALGEVSNVWKCALKTSGRIVAVKAMRGIQSDLNARNRFEEQLGHLAEKWQELEHPNVMPCLGLTMQFGPIPALVFPMCSEGSIMKYVESHPTVNKLQLMAQVAAGFSYLHNNGFVHADVRGSNIMISDDGTPQIMDAGLSLIVSRADFTVASLCGPCRWMPPEVLDPSDEYDEYEPDSDSGNTATVADASPFTKQSDIYSLGMTILEVSTGKAPYHHRRYDTVVILDIIRGTPPPRPATESVSEGLWKLLQCCWESSPMCRPTARIVELWLDTLWMTETVAALRH